MADTKSRNNLIASPFDILHEDEQVSQMSLVGVKKSSINSMTKLSSTGNSNIGSIPRIAQEASILPEIPRQIVLEASQRVEDLLIENEKMRQKISQQENDLMDLVTVFKQENDERDTKIRNLQNDLASNKESWEKERAKLVIKHQEEVTDLKANISEKESNMLLIQQELHVIKDFRKKRHQLFKELDHQRNEVQEMDKRYKETLMKMEKKFLEEKIRLQREANRKISELASKAHKEAISNLSETQRTVFKENVRMAEALRFHIQEREDLTKQNSHLQEVHKSMGEEKKLHDEIVKQKILQTKSQNLRIQELERKIVQLEHSLSFVIREFEHERKLIGEMARKELEQVKDLAQGLRQRLKSKTEEMNFIRSLARYIYDQRSDLERFFLDALDQVRQVKSKEIAERQRAQMLFHREMVRQGKGLAFPQIQRNNTVFRNVSPVLAAASSSTKTLEEELAAAAIMSNNDSNSSFHRKADSGAGIDISELTLEEKEKVLRVLFTKMNGSMTDPTYTSGHGDGLFSGPNKLRFDMAQTPVTPSGYSLNSASARTSPDRSESMSPDSKGSNANLKSLSSSKSNNSSKPSSPTKKHVQKGLVDDPDVIVVREDPDMIEKGEDEQQQQLQSDQPEPQFGNKGMHRRSITRLKDADDDGNDSNNVIKDSDLNNNPYSLTGSTNQEENNINNETFPNNEIPKSPKSSLRKDESNVIGSKPNLASSIATSNSPTPLSPRRSRVQFHNQVRQLEFQKDETEHNREIVKRASTENPNGMGNNNEEEEEDFITSGDTQK